MYPPTPCAAWQQAGGAIKLMLIKCQWAGELQLLRQKPGGKALPLPALIRVVDCLSSDSLGVQIL